MGSSVDTTSSTPPRRHRRRLETDEPIRAGNAKRSAGTTNERGAKKTDELKAVAESALLDDEQGLMGVGVAPPHRLGGDRETPILKRGSQAPFILGESALDIAQRQTNFGAVGVNPGVPRIERDRAIEKGRGLGRPVQTGECPSEIDKSADPVRLQRRRAPRQDRGGMEVAVVQLDPRGERVSPRVGRGQRQSAANRPVTANASAMSRRGPASSGRAAPRGVRIANASAVIPPRAKAEAKPRRGTGSVGLSAAKRAKRSAASMKRPSFRIRQAKSSEDDSRI